MKNWSVNIDRLKKAGIITGWTSSKGNQNKWEENGF